MKGAMKLKFIERIKEEAKADVQTIVLPEALDIRVLEATEEILKEKIADIILIGKEEEIMEKAGDLDISAATIVDPDKFEDMPDYIEGLVEKRKHRGMTEEQATELLKEDPLYLAVMMVEKGMAGGMVAGAASSTANVLRPSLQVLGTAEGTELVSTFFIMSVPNCELGDNGSFLFSDCALVQNPSPEELAAIAGSSAASFEDLLEKKARVAMLSHSTKGSAAHADIDKVVEATKIAKEKYPEFDIDGEFQLDAAIVPSIGKSKAPDSEIAGNANVLIFPDIDAGNIGYKLVQQLAKADAYGPITQGIAKPVNDLSRGCSREDIIGVTAITAVQASNQSK